MLYIGIFDQNVCSHNPQDLNVHTSQSNASKKLGYKVVGDNIDKGMKARYMRYDAHCNKSIHYFHSFAVLNRVDFSSLPDEHPNTCLNHPYKVALSLLPSADDDRALRKLFVVHISRILFTHVPYFRLSFDGVIEWHIKHKYYEEMTSKSEVVSFFYLKLILFFTNIIFQGTPWSSPQK